MGVVANLLDQARARRSIPTDMALGERLGRSRAVVSQWRKGDRYPEDEVLIALADLAGVEATKVLVSVQAERTTGPAHRAWVELARHIGAAAAISAVALLALGVIDVGAHNGVNSAASAMLLNVVGGMHYAKWLMRALRRLAATVSPFRPAFAA